MHENLSIKYNAHTRRSNLSTHVPPPTSSGKKPQNKTLLLSHPSLFVPPPQDPLTNPPSA